METILSSLHWVNLQATNILSFHSLTAHADTELQYIEFYTPTKTAPWSDKLGTDFMIM